MLTSRDNAILDFVEQYEGITIYQAAEMFFSNAKYREDLARKRLKKLANQRYLKYENDWATNQRIYYSKKKPSSHSIMLLNFYAKLISFGAEIIEFEKEYKIDNICRPDGFIIFSYNGKGKIAFIEIDMQHKTKLEKYQKLYELKLFQREYNTFPQVIIISSTKEYKIEYPFSIQILDYQFKDFKRKILKF